MRVIVRCIKKFSLILTGHQKKRILELVFIMIFGGFLEMLGVSLILPFMEAITNESSFNDNFFVILINDVLKINTHEEVLIATSIALAIIYIFKNAYFLLQTRIQNKFVYRNMFAVQEKLLINYLRKPYEYFLGIKSGEVLRIIEDDTASTFALLLSLLSLISETIVTGILTITIFVLSPLLTMGMVIILLVLMVIILKVIFYQCHFYKCTQVILENTLVFRKYLLKITLK